MFDSNPIPLGNQIYLIDGFDMEIPKRTGIYVIDEEQLTIVETGPSPSVKYIRKGLEKIGRTLNDINYIIVTHIHLDHAGGAGLLLQQCPNAKVVVHPRGAKHLADPRRLVSGARAIYGDSFSDFFDPVIPIPNDRIIVKGEGDTLKIGSNRELTFFDTPGHARHHFSIYDSISNGMFTGDTAGIRYEQLAQEGIHLYLPTTSPNHFDPEAMKQSIRRFQKMDLSRIYFGHFGMTDYPQIALQSVLDWLDVFMEEANRTVDEGKGYDVLADRMFLRVQKVLDEKGIPRDHDVYIILNLDMQISALGIMDYYQKMKH
ncbi:MBL fold metallo-hydrolase [Fervidibacillus halotolerans]|uniref:MBL fold metallo-hydrolase n=1 Tax=Fervidibacillus halotolerans TaxID=2980027 RepID=A0A9E8LYV3_9BACI|nr:MBL fold metallo-hydrolase [Fervidibacillus halotolerans]WAA11947.1 MBL fold metallo-hydrolase [Fervidibacillus halotolerans]